LYATFLMPNVINVIDLPRGYFYESDTHIVYETFPTFNDSNAPDDTITLIGFTQDNNHIFFKLLDIEENLIALLRVVKINLCGQEFYKIYKIGSKIRLKGYAKYLYNVAVRHCNYPLISDLNLTRPGSFNIWQSFIVSRINAPYTVQVINTNECSISDYDSRKHETSYWGFDEDMLEVYKDEPENLEYQYNDGMMEEDLYEFLRDNLKTLKNRNDIRFVLTYDSSFKSQSM
jgi:hypothetical protein